MKLFLTILVALILSLQAQSQKTQTLEGMSQTEIRKLIMTQTESAKALQMIKKHNTSRIASYIFFGSGLVLLASQDSSNEKNAVLSGFYGGTLLIAGLITTIAANERLKKAVNYYESDIQKAELKPNIRSELTTIEFVKYPKPH